MIAANKGNIIAIKLILKKLYKNKQLLKQVLDIKNSGNLTALDIAIRYQYKKCVKLILQYSNIKENPTKYFLPCCQINIVDMAKQIWNINNNNINLLEIKDDSDMNVFDIVCQNGNYDTLKWLLTLNKDNNINQKYIMLKNSKNLNQSPFYSLVIKYKRVMDDKLQKDKLKNDNNNNNNYLKCIKLILNQVFKDNINKKKDLLFEYVDNYDDNNNVFLISLSMGNLELFNLFLSNINEIDLKNKILDDFKYFTNACDGGNRKLLELILLYYKKENKVNQILKNNDIFANLISNGNINICEWLLFNEIKDVNERIKLFNSEDHILNCAKSGRKIENSLKKLLFRLFKEIEINQEIKKKLHCLEWVINKYKEDDYELCKLIISKLEKNIYNKYYISYLKPYLIHLCCKSNHLPILNLLLDYLENYYRGYLSQNKNGLTFIMKAVKNGRFECTKIIFDRLKNNELIKEQLISIKDNQSKYNIIEYCIIKKNTDMLKFILDNCCKNAFLLSINESNKNIASYILQQTINDEHKYSIIKSTEINTGNNCLMLAF